MIIKFNSKIKFFVVKDKNDNKLKVVERSEEFLANKDKYIISMMFKHKEQAEQFVKEYNNEQNLKALKEVIYLSDDELILIDDNKHTDKKEKELPKFLDELLNIHT